MLLTNLFPLYKTDIVDIITTLRYLVVASCVVAFLGYMDVAKKMAVNISPWKKTALYLYKLDFI